MLTVNYFCVGSCVGRGGEAAAEGRARIVAILPITTFSAGGGGETKLNQQARIIRLLRRAF
jgi:hypothetical protein